MAGDRVEVDAELGDVDRHLRRRLGAVGEDQRAGLVGQARDLGQRVLGAEHVGDVGDRDQLRPALEQRREGLHVEQPVVVDRRPVDLRPDPLGELLPGDDVGVVLHLGQEDAVAGADVGVAPGARDQVDRLGRVADEDHLAPVGGADVVGDRRPRPLVGCGRLGRERVRAAVDVGVVAALVAVDRLDRGQHPLGAGAAVEVGDRLAVDLALERREGGADLLDRERPRRRAALFAVAGSIVAARLGGSRPPRPPRGSSRSPSPRARRPAPGRLP